MAQKLKLVYLFSIIFLSWLVACRQETPVVPTAMPLAAFATAVPDSGTVLPPTRDLTLLTPTAVPPTAPPTRPPTATPTPITAIVHITDPAEETTWLLGEEVSVQGLIQREENQKLFVSLVSSTGHLLAETQATVQADDTWDVSFVLPPFVTGTAFVRATVYAPSGEMLHTHDVQVNLSLDTTNTTDRYLLLSRPMVADSAVSGFTMFFDGQIFRPAGSKLTISIWTNECQEEVARQSFILGNSSGGFYWQGFVVVPEDLSGPACAVAYFGEIGSENWREAQVSITILSQGDETAKGVLVLNPVAGKSIIAGQELFINGTALNVREGPVTVELLLDNGRVLGQALTTTDYWGYWEARIILPIDTLGTAQLTVTVGESGDNNYSEAQTLITIEPAPTPTAVP